MPAYCTHTNFEKLVSLVVTCGGEDVKTFLETAGKNAMYTSRIAVTEFIEALGTWVEVFAQAPTSRTIL